MTASSTKRLLRSPLARSAALWALRLVLGGLFTLAGVLKFAAPGEFALEIHNYQLFPALAPVLAAALPAVEIAVGVAVLAAPRPWLRAGALVSTALMVIFTLAVGSAVARDININCGCFGAGASPVTLITVLRDVALLAASGALLRLTGDGPGSPSPAARPPPAAACTGA